MSLSKEQYEEIMLQYAQIRAGHLRTLRERRRRVLALIPGFRELEEEGPRTAVRSLRRRLGTGTEASAAVSDAESASGTGEGTDPRPALHEIADKKRKLLLANGYPEDYLDLQYDCPDCKDTGMIGNTKCRCFKKRELELLYDQSHIRALVAEAGFDKLSEEYYEGEDLRRFRSARAAAMNFVSTFGREYSNLYFYGTVGTGKSFLSACIAGAVLQEGHSVLYYSAAALFAKLASLSFDYRHREDLQNLTGDLYTCDLLVIDDLGTELTNQFISTELFTCLNERHLNRKPTIISTNLTLEELQKRYSDRLFSRITSNYRLCKLTGKDIRILKLGRMPRRAYAAQEFNKYPSQHKESEDNHQ